MAEPIQICIPRDSVNDDSAKILVWKMASGTPVEKDQLICEVETSKAVMEIHAPESGVLEYTCAEGDEVPIGATICAIFPSGEIPVREPHTKHSKRPEGVGPARLSAAARAAVTELGVDASSFPPGALVRREDVLRKSPRWPQDVGDSTDKDQTAPGEAATRGVPVRWEELPRRKLSEGRALRQGRRLAVQSSVTSICRTALLSSRMSEAGVAVAGLQSIIIFEAARLLRKHAKFNAVYDGGRIGFYDQVNIGWALDGGEGLVVPVIADADRKTVAEISSSMQTQLEAYLEKRLSAADFFGATFTVTDLSSSASFFQPLLAPGQSAVLGLGIGPQHDGQGLLYLTLAFDHQVAEGKSAGEFLQDLRERLEIQASLAPGEVERQDSGAADVFCVLCHRDRRTLQRSHLILLKSEIPSGYVCSLCVAGW